ncbi:hypothetical protein CGG80_23715 [Vibrio parahaemolyticus]|uniref:DUF6572 domain-containing protein n=1 Tax=Vibrio parahaemolyticus TaxID=670 RepID=UPI001122DAB5|nr:DUF6572 domain-containing protein [Vibrio parahaemolyticus]EGQ7858299.1 hypothetical protein [Vibrio parahaemolyticus]MBE4245377.1 hypothetical protein [Vibrio parahaemolyticus]MDF4871465.1 hypothetical protein [Vibrio parahaemolyticus]TOF18360.1 hypothetical protein CGJ26_23545 [Vibrio parahaemolyticus]TOQ03319.1 hypothetical protein CGH03_21980 [Vibrio parahaemolyticus]
MTIEQLDKVDVIAHDNEKVILVISDHLEWDDQNEKLLLLQDKLNLYLSFIESGEIFEQYPIAKGKLFEIRIVSKYQPNREAEKFVSLVSKVVSDAGFSLTHELGTYN